jgi:exosortase F-associated protein
VIVNSLTRIIVGLSCTVALITIFLFQRYDLVGSLDATMNPMSRFLFNKAIRFFLNDAFAIGLVYALFNNRKYIIFSVYVQLFGMILFLVPYFISKIYFPNYNGPLISFLHRLILNPTLVLLLIPAFYYQQRILESKRKH